ncbi:helix-turn-helix domain-containing protein [Scytonema sp. UIC 10036]|uniref:DNA-3-methyladenine glycosylase 2 family protein n=1 Tax=Scytonema sp. UIC 10036 TaxID=2304196 RepID=UPI0012DAE0E6|nr:DNA-3-methyladenine glycosylase 2 family protein [Scytonema sp. UIC 10036]MUH01739.1 helix-turn-helix domain-containing protein [Scytonema sp. UIC 10036]
MLTDEQCYRAILSRDRRFDGIFFVGVSSTGIYCRTVCTVKTPRRENCTFYPSAAAAERAGYRPCLRCRPELAPGQAKIDAVGRLAAAAASYIEDGALTERSVSELANSLGVSDRHLRRVLQQEFGVSPIQLAQTQRLLLAKRLLTDSNLSITEIAFASGFSSVRRLNALFQKHYRLNPTALRKVTNLPQDILRCELAYRPPLDWQGLLSFLQGRASRGIEAIEGNCYQRTVRIDQYQGWIRVSPITKQDKLQVELSASLVAVILPVLTRVKALFDLAADPVLIAHHLRDLTVSYIGLRVPGAFDGFEVAVRAILGQQVSVKAATTLMGRLIETFGTPIQTPITGLTNLTPTPAQIAQLSPQDLTALGILLTRATSIIALAQAIVNKDLRLDTYSEIDRTIVRLKTLPGIGEWTAQYIAMRVLAYPDAFPHADLGLRRALNVEKPAQVLQIAEPWRPWRAYAAMYLWKSLEQVG